MLIQSHSDFRDLQKILDSNSLHQFLLLDPFECLHADEHTKLGY